MLTSPSPGVRKHSKTFTGCWTCRSRKVKCDEAKPACCQCRAKGLQCGGYGVRLHWMSSRHGCKDSAAARPNTQRSLIALDPSQPALDSVEVDSILSSIDAFETSSPSSSHGGVERPLFIHNFGVFKPDAPVANTTQALFEPVDSSLSSQSPSHQSENDLAELNFGDIAAGLTELNQPFVDSLNHHNSLQGDLSQYGYLDHVESLPPDDLSSLALQDPSTSWFDLTGLPLTESHDESPNEGTLTFPQSTHSQWRTPTTNIIRSPSIYSLPELEQFLMHHYTHHAVNLFCVIDNQKSPWKTIHLPRVLQSIGQLNVGFKSSTIRDALRNALLSISAFSLSNESKTRMCADDASRWKREASVLRAKAIELLQTAINNDFNGKTRPKYKEFLATMLSMVTINVMSGDLRTCGMHLDGAYRFIAQSKMWKSRFSPKARSLHRIYFYLRTIYESTSVETWDKLLSSSPSLGTPQIRRPLLLNSIEEDLPDDIYPSLTVSDIPEPGNQMTTYEYIYGVPQNLLVLICKTTSLIREVVAARQDHSSHLVIPTHLENRCDELERAIMDWPIDMEMRKCGVDDMSSHRAVIIRRTTVAFHNALIIYFAQHIRLLGHRYLRCYVQAVLDSVEAIERIKADVHVLAAPMYWPVFIAASEAFSEDLQRQVRGWYERVEAYGFEAVRTSIAVLMEVWARGPAKRDQGTSQWSCVVKDTGSILMLS